VQDDFLQTCLETPVCNPPFTAVPCSCCRWLGPDSSSDDREQLEAHQHLPQRARGIRLATSPLQPPKPLFLCCASAVGGWGLTVAAMTSTQRSTSTCHTSAAASGATATAGGRCATGSERCACQGAGGGCCGGCQGVLCGGMQLWAAIWVMHGASACYVSSCCLLL
jgi:hypothetical protein